MVRFICLFFSKKKIQSNILIKIILVGYKKILIKKM